jgi:hypothetical protein
MLRMDEINKIRKDYFVNGLNLHQIATKYARSWATINEYVSLSEESIRSRGKRPGRKKKVITPEVITAIEDYLQDEINKKVHRKQRYSSEYIFKKLKENGLYKGSSRSLRDVIKKIREDLKQNKKKNESFLELDFPVGEYLQVDHGPAEIELVDVRVNGYLFVCSVPGTSIRYCQFYLTKAREAWGHFHQQFFGFFGGTFDKCIYDNDSVLKVSSTNKPTKFCDELQIYYKFEAVFCNKGAGHEKGSVEGSVGFCRRNYMAGVPQYKTINDLNFHLFNECQKEILTGKFYKNDQPLQELFSKVAENLSSLPAEREWGIWEDLKVDKFQCIQWKGYKYSLPEKYIGSIVKTFITVNLVKIFDDTNVIFCHQRRFTEADDALILDHYLEQLSRKPTAIKFAKVMRNELFPDHLLELRQRLRSKYDIKEADLEFIKILFLKRQSSSEDFNCAIEVGLSFGGLTAGAISSIIKQLQLSQTSNSLDQQHLPEQCQTNIDHHFNLSQYDSLTNNERSEYD